MNSLHFIQTLTQQLLNTSVWEWIAVIFGILEVLLALKNNVLLYPAGIIGTVVSIYLLASVSLYAESALNVYYLVMSIYGWIHWMHKRSEPKLPVTKASKKEWLISILIVVLSWFFLFLILSHFTTSDVPVWDAWVSSTAWAGMWLLAKRKLENWILLNVSNLFAIPLLIHKHIPLYAILTLVLFIVAIFGYLKWRKILQLQTQLQS